VTSRERVRKTINHEIPDYVPNGLGGCETEGLHVLAYYSFQEAIGLPPVPPKICTFMTNAVFEPDVIKKMKGDIVLLASPRMCKSLYRKTKYAKIEDLWKEQVLWDKKFMIPAADKFTNKDGGSIIWETADNAVCPNGGYFFDWVGDANANSGFYDDIYGLNELPLLTIITQAQICLKNCSGVWKIPRDCFMKKQICRYV